MDFKYEFLTSPRFEIFYAIQLLTDDSSKVHNEWKKKAISELPDTFLKKLKRYGLQGPIWSALADMIENSILIHNFAGLVNALREISTKEIQNNVMVGILHYPDIVKSILDKEFDLTDAIKKIPKKKHEWLAYVGLYPSHKDSSINQMIEILLNNPEDFRNLIIDILQEFWASTFKNTWKDIYPKLEETASEKKRLCDICTLSEFAKNSLIPIEVDENKKQIIALRGGYSIQFANVEKLIFLPSVFNYKRLWTAYEAVNSKTTAYFPFFDPRISLTNRIIYTSEISIDSGLDPALIFKALGDVTRFAIVSIIAREPKSSVELSKILSITKATISHHVHILREAGLLNERHESGSVKLSLKRDIIENLSDLTIERLYKNSR